LLVEYWVIGLLGYWVIGLLGYWVIGFRFGIMTTDQLPLRFYFRFLLAG